ncbi:MAG: glutamine synthetase [Rickettsiales bacterium]|jgi:glutamine synthetase
MNNLLTKIRLHKKIILESILAEFSSRNLQPKIGIELEFYLEKESSPTSQKDISEFISRLKLEIPKHNIDIQNIEPEQGIGQIEIKTSPYLDIKKLCSDINKIKEITNNIDENFQVNFSSQPRINDCGNSLQINFSLISNGKFLFTKDEREESKYLLNSIFSSLRFTKNMMLVFAQETEDYLRLDLELNRNLHQQKKYTAPVNISWGYNNRTTLVRIPESQKDSDRRLEFRLASSSADTHLIIIFFLLAVLEGLENEALSIPAIYGNSFDDQYNLEKLPSYSEAKDYFVKNNPLIDKILFILSQSELD